MPSTPDYNDLRNMIIDVATQERNNDVSERKKQILEFIDHAIEKGNVSLYVAKATLSAADKWETCKTTNIPLFQSILLEGIDKGCLAPQNHIAWEWMDIAAKYNDPNQFANDMEVLNDIIGDAADEGVEEAIDIFNMIWEPENIIEED